MSELKMIEADWNNLAWNEEGKKISPLFKCFDGTVIELCKNYVYLKTKGEIIAIYNGELEGHSFFLYIERFRFRLHNAIFIVVYDPNIDKHFFGIGAYDWNAIEASDPLKEKFIEWVKSLPKKTTNLIVTENDIPSSFEGL